jgi:SAM-dependent methyltransferase
MAGGRRRRDERAAAEVIPCGDMAMATRVTRQQNLARRASENWKAPPLSSPRTTAQGWASRLRRYFDLQAGSVWNDVSELVADCRGKVVDVGCGAQPYRGLLPPGVEYVGIDIAEAGARFGYEAPDTVYFAGGRWPKEAEGADVLLCTEALEHVPDPASFLQEAYRCLRPGGALVATVPFAARWHFIPFDYWRFTPSGLERLLEGAGFRGVQVWARGNAVTVACYKSMALLLPLLFPQSSTPAGVWLRRAAGAPFLPVFVALAVVANASLRADGGDDCLGYTVMAVRPA